MKSTKALKQPQKNLGLHLLFSLAFALLYISQANAQAKSKENNISKLRNIFKSAPDSIQTTVYWYWVSGNLSHTGVVKDLEAMKKVGITRAFIANITWGEKNSGNITMFSAEWWAILQTAFKTATRLGIDIGMFNCPGWSQSGGPWVKPQQSMRYLCSSEEIIKGPGKIKVKLIVPTADFQDVKCIAYPASKGYLDDLRSYPTQIKTNQDDSSAQHLLDREVKTNFMINPEKVVSIEYTYPINKIANSIIFKLGRFPMKAEGDIMVKEGGDYRILRHFTIDRTNPNIRNGFSPYGPAVITVPESKSKQFKIVFNKSSYGTLSEILFYTTPYLESYLEKTLAKMSTTALPLWSAYQWETQLTLNSRVSYLDPTATIDLSKYLSPEGLLEWDVPPGDWIVERLGMSSTRVENVHATPESTGLETDKMSIQHITSHFNNFIVEIIKRIPAKDRKCWKTVVIDSYETGSQNWTDSFIDKFRSAYKYDPVPFLPVFQGKIVGDPSVTDRFLWDIRRLVADHVAHNYVGQMTRLSHQYGLQTWIENYGHYGFPGEFLQYGGQADEVSGEFWNEGSKGYLENKAAASCAHIYGKAKVSAESFTTTEKFFQNYPATLKKRLDRSFTEGINNTLLHVYLHQNNNNLPGMNAYFGTEFNRNNTWFYDMDGFVKYIKRCNYLLQQGHYVADIAYFIGEDAPKMTGIQIPELPKGYSFDYINAEMLLRLEVTKGLLTLPKQMQYRLLVLPPLKTMRPDVLKKLKYLIDHGAAVVGPKPLLSPSLERYPNADADIKSLAESIWNSPTKNYQNNDIVTNKVITTFDLREVLDAQKILPDFLANNCDSIEFLHRQVGATDIYFVSNQKDTTIDFTAQFRIISRQPQVWDPVDGSINNIQRFSSTGTGTTIALKLEANQSVFVVFVNREQPYKSKLALAPKSTETIDLSSDWQVKFDKSLRGPSNTLVFKSLKDWITFRNDSIKYYSGSAMYSKTIKINKAVSNEKTILNIGKCTGIAKIWINGVLAGDVWTAPYQLNISGTLRTGTNHIQIKIVNNWINRIIGDLKIPQKQRHTKYYYDFSTDKVALQSSGLLGPVQLQIWKNSTNRNN